MPFRDWLLLAMLASAVVAIGPSFAAVKHGGSKVGGHSPKTTGTAANPTLPPASNCLLVDTGNCLLVNTGNKLLVQ